jgi:hypothetical protein
MAGDIPAAAILAVNSPSCRFEFHVAAPQSRASDYS